MSPIHLSPDGIHYLRAAEGLAVPHPYRLRWLLPRLLGPHPERWRVLTYVSLALLPFAALLFFWSRGLTGARLAFAVALLCALPGLRLSFRLPVLIDAPSFTGALLVAASATVTPWWVTVPAALLLGAMRESAPVFVALWSWSPLPLVGVLACGWWREKAEPHPSEPWLAHPWREAWRLRKTIGLDGSLYVRPWGAALAGLLAPSWQMAATLAVAHGQLLMAQDTLRLAVWAGPVLVMGAAEAIPAGPAWWAVAILITAMLREDRA